jgi:hypothetical protein
MANHKKYKINGKAVVRADKSTKATAKSTTTTDGGDAEVLAKIEELHVFLTQRGLPYFIVSRTPESKTPIARFSFNHKHDDPVGTRENGEYIFTVAGNAIDQLTQSHMRLVKFY